MLATRPSLRGGGGLGWRRRGGSRLRPRVLVEVLVSIFLRLELDSHWAPPIYKLIVAERPPTRSSRSSDGALESAKCCRIVRNEVARVPPPQIVSTWAMNSLVHLEVETELPPDDSRLDWRKQNVLGFTLILLRIDDVVLF